MADTLSRNAGLPGLDTTDCGTTISEQEKTTEQITVTFTTIISGHELCKHIFCMDATTQACNANLRDKGYTHPAGTKYYRANASRLLAPSSYADHSARIFGDVQICPD